MKRKQIILASVLLTVLAFFFVGEIVLNWFRAWDWADYTTMEVMVLLAAGIWAVWGRR